VEKTEGYTRAQRQTTDRPKGEEEGKLMTIDPTAGNNIIMKILKEVTCTSMYTYCSALKLVPSRA
jgi:hypothetical protein